MWAHEERDLHVQTPELRRGPCDKDAGRSTGQCLLYATQRWAGTGTQEAVNNFWAKTDSASRNAVQIYHLLVRRGPQGV